MKRLVPCLLLALAVGASGCARTIAPTGGEVPEFPPLVVQTSPDTFAVVQPFGGAVTFHFERTLSERLATGSLRDAVVVSPRTGEVEVRQRGNRVEVRMEGGFRAPAVYRVTLLPRFQDRYQNRMDRPVELFFSTGPAFDPTLVAGLVVDRITGQDFPQARVEAIPEAEGPAYAAVSDSTGVFAFRYLPPGAYRLVAWDDRNRNRALDPSEPVAETRVSVASADTLVVAELALLAPDTTPAVLASARALDSVTVEVTFDDYLAPEWDPSGVLARLLDEDGAPAAALPRVVEVLHHAVWEQREAEAAAADAADDPDDPDTPAPTAEPADPPEPLLPDRRLVLVLEGPLPPGVTLTVEVERVENVNGVGGGGGEVTFETPPAPEPAAPPDPGLPPDSGG
jgi:hypothetical protein